MLNTQLFSKKSLYNIENIMHRTTIQNFNDTSQSHQRLLTLTKENQSMVQSLRQFGHYVPIVKVKKNSYQTRLEDISKIQCEGQQGLAQQIILQQQNDAIKRLVKFQQKQQELFNMERNVQLQQLSYNYHYLRSQWTRYRSSNSMDLDGKLDRLSKIVASIRHKATQRLHYLRHETIFRPQQLDEFQLQCLAILQQKYERCMMKQQDLASRMIQMDQQRTLLKSQNEKLQNQLQKTRQKLKKIQNQYLSSSAKTIQLEQTLYNINKLKLKQRLQNKLVYSNPVQDFIVEIRGNNIQNAQLSTQTTLQRLRDALEQVERDADIQNNFMIKGTQSEKRIQPVKIFNLMRLTFDDITVNNTSPTQDNKQLSSNGDKKNFGKKPLSRQASQGQLSASVSNGIIKRTPNIVANTAKFAYIRNPSRDKNSHIQKNFYVKIENIEKGSPIL